MNKIIIILILIVISFVFLSQCISPSQNIASQTQTIPSCIKVHCVPKTNDPGKPSCTSERLSDFSNTECNKPSAPIVGIWEGYGTTEALSNAKFVFSDNHVVTMTAPSVGTITENWYRCGDELDCLNSGLNNNNYIILGNVFTNEIIYYDGTGNSIEILGNKFVKQ